jgi:integrase
MVKRAHGEGTIYWHEGRQRWAILVTLGYDPTGKRVRKYAYGRTKTEARSKLRELLRDAEDGVLIANDRCTVEDAVRDWLDNGLGKAEESTRKKNQHLAQTHIIPLLGARRLRELTVADVDKWLAGRAKVVSTSTLRMIHSAWNRSIKRAMAQDKVKRNVVELAALPKGREGRQSKSLTLAQASAILHAVEGTRMHAYVVLSLLTGARTEELRALLWEDVDLLGRLDLTPPVPSSMAVWRSVRATGDTKTRRSRRTLALPARCVDVLSEHGRMQARLQAEAGKKWIDLGLVFTTRYGTPLDVADVRRDFRAAIGRAPAIDADAWTPRELRHSFVSLLSDSGVPIDEISRLVGHRSTVVTEIVYRRQLRPVIQSGATVMDRLFADAKTHLGGQFGGQEPPEQQNPAPSRGEPGSELG